MGEAARQAMDRAYDRRHACEAWEKLLKTIVSGRTPDVADVTGDGTNEPAPPGGVQAHGDTR
jgi:hypothetical protein